jgi:hypothetical protein
VKPERPVEHTAHVHAIDELNLLSNVLRVIWVSSEHGDIAHNVLGVSLDQVDPENIATSVSDGGSQPSEGPRGIRQLDANGNGV